MKQTKVADADVYAAMCRKIRDYLDAGISAREVADLTDYTYGYNHVRVGYLGRAGAVLGLGGELPPDPETGEPIHPCVIAGVFDTYRHRKIEHRDRSSTRLNCSVRSKQFDAIMARAKGSKWTAGETTTALFAQVDANERAAVAAELTKRGAAESNRLAGVLASLRAVNAGDVSLTEQVTLLAIRNLVAEMLADSAYSTKGRRDPRE